MKNYTFLFLFIVNASIVFSQLPDTDIWLLDVVAKKDTIMLINPVNITQRIGYDNQPSFSLDSKYLLFSSIRDDKQSDIYKYDLISKITSQFTFTSNSEYSPTFMPDGENISVVMVEKDSVQRLWKIPITEGDASLIMSNIDSIGYHYWIDKNNVALIMTTEPTSLEIANINTQNHKIVAKGIGRCMKKNNDNSLLFVQKISEQDGVFSELNLTTLVRSNYNCFNTKTLENSEDFAYADFIIMAKESKIYWLNCKSGRWNIICDLSKNKIKKITRIVVSENRKKMAIVAESN